MTMATAENGWISRVEGENSELLERAERIIASTLYCTLSTCSPDGCPWASPVFFVYDATWTIYWSSAIASRHSQNLYQNQGRLAIAIYSTSAGEGKGQGVYLSGYGKELAPERVGAVMQQLFARAGREPPQRTASDYLGTSPRRIYQFEPEAAWMTGERLAVGNQLVDTKVVLDLRRLFKT
ncbi:MAG: pyridoxamine 5'-phosphate oxidase family protein [Leptolyngbya sp. SIO4C5]|nr:pyridoxamine 5'-phosphate oxidase family protein [Leptolyngbya sp. SIO4C5]